MDSILTSVKKLLGIDEAYEQFDNDLIMDINSVFMILNQLGVGVSGFNITGASETWSDFLGDELKNFQSIKTYVYQKVRLMFDPPSNSFVVEAFNKQIAEFEWRLNVQTEWPD